jgi:hypothetical protein
VRVMDIDLDTKIHTSIGALVRVFSNTAALPPTYRIAGHCKCDTK